MGSLKQGEEIRIELPFHMKILLDKWADYAAGSFAAMAFVGLLQIADRVPVTVWIGLAAFALVKWGKNMAENALVKKVFEQDDNLN